MKKTFVIIFYVMLVYNFNAQNEQTINGLRIETIPIVNYINSGDNSNLNFTNRAEFSGVKFQVYFFSNKISVGSKVFLEIMTLKGESVLIDTLNVISSDKKDHFKFKSSKINYSAANNSGNVFISYEEKNLKINDRLKVIIKLLDSNNAVLYLAE